MSKEMNDAQRKLVEDNLKLVYHVVSKQYPTFVNDEDIIQSGTLGLCNAALNWDENKSAFSTYACRCIQNAIRAELRERQPHMETLSLDCPIGEDLTLGDTIADDGEAMVDYTFLQTLTPDERLVFELRVKGCDVAEIEQFTGFNHRKVLQLIRIAQIKYRRYN